MQRRVATLPCAALPHDSGLAIAARIEGRIARPLLLHRSDFGGTLSARSPRIKWTSSVPASLKEDGRGYGPGPRHQLGTRTGRVPHAMLVAKASQLAWNPKRVDSL